MDYVKVLEACDVLEQHNVTGVPVFKATCGRWYENVALKLLIDSCRELVNRNIELSMLRNGLLIELIEVESNKKVVKNILDLTYDMGWEERDGEYWIRVNENYWYSRRGKSIEEVESFMINLANLVNEVSRKLFGIKE